MLFSIPYLILRGMLRLVPSAGGGREREVEILVLRHHVKGVIEESRPPEAQAVGQSLPFSAAARMLPRERRESFLVTPATLLRWHQELVRRKWTDRRKPVGRPPMSSQVGELILRLAKENPRWGCVRIQGELSGSRNPGGSHDHPLAAQRNGLGPAPRRHDSFADRLLFELLCH